MSLRHPLSETLSALGITGAISGYLPLMLAIPGAIYYCLLIWDRWHKRQPGAEILELKKRITAITAGNTDSALIAIVLGLAAAGVAIAMIIASGF